ncbi:MAG: nuclear transport factor 2 family protein [Alphaproteobacteria bacterium]|nr:nuclear transport factor 2 family protein [Alphaproteobacteria bacterium]
MQSDAGFDFVAFKEAFVGKNRDAWLGFFADDAEWIEYRHNAPPRSPNRMSGKQQIGSFLTGVCGAPVRLAISDEVLGRDRAAFCVTCELPNGNRIIEHVIIHVRDGRIARQVDVEAWD